MCGGSTAAMNITMVKYAPEWLAMGVDPQHIHRLSTIASCTLDTMPHHGGMAAQLQVSRLNHKQMYLHYAAVCLMAPIPSCIIAGCMASAGIF